MNNLLFSFIILVGASGFASAPADTLNCESKLLPQQTCPAMAGKGGHNGCSRIYLSCPDGRSGYLNETYGYSGHDIIGKDPAEGPYRAKIKVLTQNNKVLEVDHIMDPANAEIAWVAGQDRGSLLEEDIQPEKLRQIMVAKGYSGSDLNVKTADIVGLTINKKDLVYKTQKTTATDDVVGPSKDGKASAKSPAECVYVSMQSVFKVSDGLLSTCQKSPLLCGAVVECNDEKLGWVQRSATCKAEKGTCPSATVCAKDAMTTMLEPKEVGAAARAPTETDKNKGIR